MVRKASEQGDYEAQFALGDLYRRGQETSLSSPVPEDFRNYTAAARWFRLVADQGAALAQLQLGMMYLKGDSVPKNYAEAARWFRKTARQGQVNAMERLGEMQRRGMLR